MDPKNQGIFAQSLSNSDSPANSDAHPPLPVTDIGVLLRHATDYFAQRPDLANALAAVVEWLRLTALGSAEAGERPSSSNGQTAAEPSVVLTSELISQLNQSFGGPFRDLTRPADGKSASAATSAAATAAAARYAPPPERDPFDELRVLVPRRARLKEAALHWVAGREAAAAGGPVVEGDPSARKLSLIAEAKSVPNCYLWMLRQPDLVPEAANELAGNYECLAVAAELLTYLLGHEAEWRGLTTVETVVSIVAESLSAVREGIHYYNDRPDPDVETAFACIRTLTHDRRIYVERFMRLDDPADPALWEERLSRLEALQLQLEERMSRQTTLQSQLKRLRYHVGRLTSEYDRPSPHPDPVDWERVVDTTVAVVQDGCPPSNRELLESLAPVADLLPDPEGLPEGEYPRPFQMVLRALDAYMAYQEAATAVDDDAADLEDAAPTPEVARVAELLAGRKLVLIGGDCRPEAQRRIEQAFKLAGLNWVEGKSHESVTHFESHIADPEVALVLLAIRWSSHNFGDVKQFCDDLDKPLVRLPSGYGTNQLAQQILDQVGLRLEQNSAIAA